MNWTGGRLNAARANKGIVNKQKEYFAKVRTRLQNGSNTLASPFRPSYFQDDDLYLGGRLPSFGSGTVRHVGHSTRLQERRNKGRPPGPSHAPHGLRTAKHHVSEATVSRRKRRGYESASPASTAHDKRNGKANAEDADSEDQLLEAKRRLLKRQDWVGLAPSRSVNMHFLSSKEKNRIGKRRKIEGRPPKRQKSNERRIRPPLHHTDGNHPSPYMSGALLNSVGDIRIRIGTDALTTHASMQQPDHAHSQAAVRFQGSSSDAMLFDHEIRYTAPEEPVQHAQSASQHHSLTVGASTQVKVVSQQLPLFSGERACGQVPKDHQQAGSSHIKSKPDQSEKGGASKSDWIQRTPVERHAAAHADSRKEEVASTFQISRHVGGVGRPLRLVFDQPSDFSADIGGSRMASQVDATCDQSAANAGLSAFGKAKRHEIDNEHGSSPPIVDDGPWKSLLAIPDNSSSCLTTARMSGSGLSHAPQSPAWKKEGEAALTVASQHATLGGHTRISTSACVSTSLPSIKRASGQSMTRDGLQGEDNRDGSRSAKQSHKQSHHSLDESEKVWQTFVFGSGNALASDTTHGNEPGEETTPFLRSSLAIPSSVSSTQFRSASGLTSCVSDDAQDAANRELHRTC